MVLPNLHALPDLNSNAIDLPLSPTFNQESSSQGAFEHIHKNSTRNFHCAFLNTDDNFDDNFDRTTLTKFLSTTWKAHIRRAKKIHKKTLLLQEDRRVQDLNRNKITVINLKIGEDRKIRDVLLQILTNET